MTDIEARSIGSRIGVRPEPIHDAPTTDDALGGSTSLHGAPDLSAGYTSPCPFLRDDRCSIYEHRPFACRTHLNMDADDLLCRLIPGEQVPVPYADANALKAIYVMAQPSARWADIRAFFSSGLPSPRS